jgi:hypothetical protein
MADNSSGGYCRPASEAEVPAQIREVAERTIGQAEDGFSAFHLSCKQVRFDDPNPTADLSLKALLLTEREHEITDPLPFCLIHTPDRPWIR